MMMVACDGINVLLSNDDDIKWNDDDDTVV